MTDWNQQARRILRSELERQGVTYKQLALSLEKAGAEVTERSIANKLSRGTFSFAFFLQAMKAIGAEEVGIDLKKL